MADIEWSQEDAVGVITLNRPEKRNAFTPTMISDWAQMLVRAQDDESVRAIVVTGAGPAFCAGADLGNLPGTPEPASGRPSPLAAKRSLTQGVQRVPLAMAHLDKPVIAAVNGAAVGAGMDMALMCDIRVASPQARFAAAYIRVGLIPGDGGCYYLPRIVGVAKALELLITGDFVDAEEALRIGLVSYVADDAAARAMALAQRFAAMPPVHVQLTKRNVYASQDASLDTALELASSHMGIVRSLDDSVEALASFQEKRPGTYRGA